MQSRARSGIGRPILNALHALLFAGAAVAVTACTENQPTSSAAPTGQVAPPSGATSQPVGAASQPSGASQDAVAHGEPVTGEVTLDAAVAAKGVQPSDVLFVMARSVAGGQPGQLVAVKRIAPVQLPHAFELSSRDLMMPGVPFTGPFLVTARLDRDGDPMTKTGDDLYATAEGTPGAGAKGVALVLKAGAPEQVQGGLPGHGGAPGQAPAHQAAPAK